MITCNKCLAKLRRIIKKLRRMSAFQEVRAENPFPTHLPVLIGINHLVHIETVLELGCGEYSTMTMIDRQAFPNLVKLVSFENDYEWYTKMKDQVLDQRVDFIYSDKPIALSIEEVPLKDYDLIFIDDSKKWKSRSQTIKTVIKNCYKRNTILIHDFEFPHYQKAAESSLKEFSITALNPNTGILWGHDNFNRRQLKKINQIIARNKSKIEPDDRQSWVEVFRRFD